MTAGAFKLAEVDMTPLLPTAALAPFAEEISSRQRRRERRVQQENRTAEREAAAAAELALAAAAKGLSADELKVWSFVLFDLHAVYAVPRLSKRQVLQLSWHLLPPTDYRSADNFKRGTYV